MNATSNGSRSRITVRDLGKSFDGTGRSAPKEVLRGVDFTVRANEFVSIVGHSGAGKTTLLRCIAGLDRPTTGLVEVDGVPTEGPPREIALIFQDYGRSLYPWLRVRDNVALPLRSKRDLSAAARTERAVEALAAVGLPDVGQMYPWQLSGGMQQRVAIARALAYEPEALLMDEPFASVDAQTRSDLEDLVLDIRRRYQMTVVLVTHDIDESVYMADRILVLGGRPTGVGEIIDVDLPAERDQLTTKSLPAFIALRARVLEAVRCAKGTAPGAAV
jgi:NitT/TauT family transport system ATP-binding protein